MAKVIIVDKPHSLDARIVGEMPADPKQTPTQLERIDSAIKRVLARRGTVTKDKTSGETQEHGEHGHFASGSSGTKISTVKFEQTLDGISNDRSRVGTITRQDRQEKGLGSRSSDLKYAVSAKIASDMKSSTKDMFALMRDRGEFHLAKVTDENGLSAYEIRRIWPAQDALFDRTALVVAQPNGALPLMVTVGENISIEEAKAALTGKTPDGVMVSFSSGTNTPYSGLGGDLVKLSAWGLGEGSTISYAMGSPEGDACIRESVASTLVSAWADSANGDINSCAVQDVAKEEFDIRGTVSLDEIGVETPGDIFQQYSGGDTAQDLVDDYVKEHHDVLSDFVHTTYDETQRTLEAAGYSREDTVTIYRGMSINGYDDAGEFQPLGQENDVDVASRPLSSWTTNSSTASRFPGDLFRSDVAVKDIFSIAATGIGCLDEREVVILGHPRSADVAGYISNEFLPKDKDSAKEQAHGFHGWFSHGDGGGEKADTVSTPAALHTGTTEQTLEYWTPPKIASIIGDQKDHNYNLPGDPVLASILEHQGFLKPPTMMDPDAFREYVKTSGATEIYRGIHGARDTVQAYSDDYIKSPVPLIGQGVIGNGQYFTTQYTTSVRYSSLSGTEHDSAGRITTAALKPDAKIFNAAFPTADRTEVGRGLTASGASRLFKSTATLNSATLAMSGYDAIRQKISDGEDYYVILNRGALVVRDDEGGTKRS